MRIYTKKIKKKNTALHVAAARGHADVVRELLTADGAEVDVFDIEGCTPLFIAVSQGHIDVIHNLLLAGADINSYNHKGLFVLSAAKNMQTIDALLGAGADVNKRTSEGSTPLHGAVINSSTGSEVPILLTAGADIQAQDDDGFTSLCHAIMQGNGDNIQILLDAGANLEERSDNDQTMAEYIQEFMSMDTDVRQSFRDDIALWRSAYAGLVKNGSSPKTSSDLYHLMSVMPLTNPKAPVDYVGNMRKICAHANWENKAQLEGILDDIHNDGRIDGVTAESILHESFPLEFSHVQNLVQSRATGRAI